MKIKCNARSKALVLKHDYDESATEVTTMSQQRKQSYHLINLKRDQATLNRLQHEKNIQPISSETRNGIYNELVTKHQEAVGENDSILYMYEVNKQIELAHTILSEGDLLKQRMYKCKLWHLSRSTDSCRMTESNHFINCNNGDIHHLDMRAIEGIFLFSFT